MCINSQVYAMFSLGKYTGIEGDRGKSIASDIQLYLNTYHICMCIYLYVCMYVHVYICTDVHVIVYSCGILVLLFKNI